MTVLESNKTPMELVPGDELECVLDGATLITTIAQNNASCFSWTGSLAGGLLHGEHRFRFESINVASIKKFQESEENEMAGAAKKLLRKQNYNIPLLGNDSIITVPIVKQLKDALHIEDLSTLPRADDSDDEDDNGPIQTPAPVSVTIKAAPE
ncbi:hypothetical protein EDB81DRAFT_767053 [Dactylonectria macrodidyma]|uniref:Uncharacterized protein n=1 Tax=Dactylonectria macrodidyma TaxID=307937 RepID=A0A9P9IF65_9HYPO|nr:hypothetical protein EDB81DRAFT_767053 [Dactylonectria macrodidyma]